MLGGFFHPENNSSWTTLHDGGFLSLSVKGLNDKSIHLQSSRRVVCVVVGGVLVAIVFVFVVGGPPQK